MELTRRSYCGHDVLNFSLSEHWMICFPIRQSLDNAVSPTVSEYDIWVETAKGMVDDRGTLQESVKSESQSHTLCSTHNVS